MVMPRRACACQQFCQGGTVEEYCRALPSPPALRWKGHQPTDKTLLKAQHRYFLDVQRFLRVPEAERDVEEEIRLRTESQRLDAMRAWLQHGRVIDRRWFIEEKQKRPENGTESAQLSLV